MYFVHGFNKPYVAITTKYKHIYFGLTKKPKTNLKNKHFPPFPLICLAPRRRATARNELFSSVFPANQLTSHFLTIWLPRKEL